MGQQALLNPLLAARYKHICKKRPRMTANVTQRIDDSYCCLNTKKIVRATSAPDDDGLFEGLPVRTQPAFYVSPGIDFNYVYAFKLCRNPEADAVKELFSLTSVVGKCVRVDDVLSVVTWNVLHDY